MVLHQNSALSIIKKSCVCVKWDCEWLHAQGTIGENTGQTTCSYQNAREVLGLVGVAVRHITVLKKMGARVSAGTDACRSTGEYKSSYKVSRENFSAARCLPLKGGSGPRNESKDPPLSAAVATVWSLAPLCPPCDEWWRVLCPRACENPLRDIMVREWVGVGEDWGETEV